MPVPRSFRLQPVLNLKEIKQEKLQVDLAARQAEEERQRQALSALESERGRQIGVLRQLTHTGPLDLTSIDASLTYLDHMENRVVSQAEATSQANAATEATRGELTMAMRERKALEKLRERQHTALRQYLRQLETNQADETAISRFTRRRETDPTGDPSKGA